MNPVLELIASPLAGRIGWVLLHSLWQGALIGGLFAVSRFILRQRSSNSRYLAGCVSLALLLVTTLVTFFVMAPDPSASNPTPVKSGFILPSTVGAYGSALVTASPSGFQRAAGILTAIAPWLALFWMAGSVCFSFRLVRSWWWVGKIRTQDNEPLDAVWMRTLNTLRWRLEISRPVRLLKSALVEVPTVIGWLRPVILLPAASLTGLSPEQLQAILAHELAHVRRLDYLVNGIQCVIEALMFYHPVMWWISRVVREERENCCDDLVIELCGDRLVYARALTTLETMRVESLQLAATGGSLINRIRRLLGATSEDQSATPRQLSGVGLLVIGLVLCGMGVALLLLPVRYSSSARIKVNHDETNSFGTNSFAFDPYALQTDVEVIRSEAVLGRVAQTMGLNELLAKKYGGGSSFKTSDSVEYLRNRVGLHPIRNTSLIEIRAVSDRLEEPARIANEVAETYKQFRLQMNLDLQTAGIRALESRLDEHNKRVEIAQQEVDRLRTELKVVDSDPSSLEPSPTVNADSIRQLSASLVSLQELMIRQELQLKNLLKLSRSEQREAIQTALEQPDVVLTTLNNELNLAEENFRKLSQVETTKSPEYVNAQRTFKDLDSKVDRRIEGILLGLQTRMETTRESLDALQRLMERSRTDVSARVQETAPYYLAKRRLVDLLQFRTALGMKIASAQTELVLPRNAQVVIIDSAPRSEPVSSNRFTAAALIGLGILLNLVGIRMLRRA